MRSLTGVDAITHLVRVKHAVLVLALVACTPHPHVQLGPLPPDPKPHQRVQMFNALHATSETTTIIRQCGGRGGCSTSTQHALQLANGTTVHHPEDLLPVIHPDSAAARSIRASMRSRSTARVYTVVALVGGIVAAIAFKQMMSNDGNETTGTKIGLYGGGGLLIVGAGGSYIYNDQAADEHGDANEQYNQVSRAS